MVNPREKCISNYLSLRWRKLLFSSGCSSSKLRLDQLPVLSSPVLRLICWLTTDSAAWKPSSPTELDKKEKDHTITIVPYRDPKERDEPPSFLPQGLSISSNNGCVLKPRRDIWSPNKPDFMGFFSLGVQVFLRSASNPQSTANHKSCSYINWKTRQFKAMKDV